MPVELLFLLVFILVIVVFFGIIAVIIAALVYFGPGDEKSKHIQELADIFGFQVAPRGLKSVGFSGLRFDLKGNFDYAMSGKYNGFDVEIKSKDICIKEPIFQRPELGGWSLSFLCCTVKFPQPLNLSLSLKSPKALPKDSDPNNINIGNPIFDSRFDATCVNQEILQKLLLNTHLSENKNLLSEILQANHYIESTNNTEIATLLNETPSHIRGLVMTVTYHLFIITDTDVTIKLKSEFDEISEESVRQIMNQTTYIAKQIYAARMNLN